MKTELKKTNYVIVVDYEEGQYLDEVYLLGWDCNTDWFNCDIDSRDIMTPKGNIKKNHNGLIDVDSHSSAYVGETSKELFDYARSAKEEGYECTVCRLEKDEDSDWRLIPEKE